MQNPSKSARKLTVALTVLTALSLLSLSCSRAGAFMLVAALESHAAPLISPLDKNAQAVVVLGGGTEREDYAAKLQRETGLPLLVSGMEAPAMVRKLTAEFGTPIKWVEKNSRTTEENAQFSAGILKQNGIERLFLVTDADHMWRAQTMFRKNGFQVIPAPVTFPHHSPLTPRDFLPSSEGFKQGRSARHELIGIAWFWVRHLIS